ncbi:uncharacterized protein TNCV_4006831 [Trichonephila clavipes]|nr:uncharacterized protein TNCV_4006831 [Trichonephila clavipes]
MKLKRITTVENHLPPKRMASKLHKKQSTICRHVKKIGDKKVNFPVCQEKSVKTVEKRRKCSWSLYLMLSKSRYKAWITSDEALFHLLFTTGKTKISSKKRRKIRAVLKNTSWPSGIMVWTEMSPQGLTKPSFVEPNFKIDAKYYQNKVLKHLIKKSKCLFPQRNFIFHLASALSHTVKSTTKWLKD